MNLRLPWAARYGWAILLPVIPLVTAGILTIQATSVSEETTGMTDMALKQLLFALAGMGMLVAILMVNYQRLGQYSFFLFGVGIFLLSLLVLDRWINLPLIDAQRNTRRWIRLGSVQLQPSEFMKIVYVLAMAWYLRYRRNYRSLRGLIAPFGLTLIPMALIKMQPDLGTLLLFLPVLFVMLYVAGAKGWHLGVIIGLGVLAMPLFWFKIAEYQRLRVTGVLLQSQMVRDYLEQPPTFMKSRPTRWDCLRPAEADPMEWRRELDEWDTHAGYQMVRSKMAIGSGGFLGNGWGQGIFVEYDFLPEKHNDFIFAMLAHQWGLFGGVIAIACYALIVLIGFDVATLTDDSFGRLVAVGSASMLGIQAITNLCMAMGLGPVTGVTLPFVSAGGSSLVSSFAFIGLIVSVAQHRPMSMGPRPFVFDEDEK